MDMDIVDRLRQTEEETATVGQKLVYLQVPVNPDGPEGANEIERLREALKKTVEVCDVVLNKEFNWAVKMTLMKENVALARAALKEGE